MTYDIVIGDVVVYVPESSIYHEPPDATCGFRGGIDFTTMAFVRGKYREIELTNRSPWWWWDFVADKLLDELEA